MSLKDQYTRFRSRLGQLTARLEILDPNSDELEAEFTQLQIEAGEIREVLTSYAASNPSFAIPRNCDEIAHAIDLIQRECRKLEVQRVQRLSVSTLVKRLRRDRAACAAKRITRSTSATLYTIC